MNIKKIVEKDNITLKIDGPIDSDNYHDFEKEILSLDYHGEFVNIDFDGVPYITSAALRVLLAARKNIEKDKLIIIDANKDVREIFESAGFAEMVTFREKEDNDPLHKSFKTLLKDMATLYSSREAYVMCDERYTWGDVDKCSQIIASDLSKLGVKKGTHVGIISMNSINWVCTFFAIQKLGGIVCSLNFNSKKEEIKLLSEIGDIDVLCFGTVTAIKDPKNYFENEISTNTNIKKIYDISQSIDFKKRYAEYDAIKGEFTDVMNADDPSLIIFTSGSTGKPKAVLSSSYNRINVFYRTMGEDDLIVTDDLCSCIYLPLFHLFAIMHALIIPLIYHSKVCIASSPKVEEVLNLIYKEKCTFFPTVPTFISAMLSYDGFKKEMVDSVRYIAFGGEPITVAQVRECNEKFVNAKVANGYGLSEMSPISNTKYGDTFDHLTKTVGRVYSPIDVKIVDMTTNEFLPCGKIGEICVKTEGAMIGYYKLDIESQAIDKRGYIRTGDLGYLCEDGYLVLTGRCKELIIRSGENISPNEIVDAISTYDDIASAKVYGVPDEKTGEAVAAAVIMKKGKKLDIDRINSFLAEKISKFKIPKYYVEFETFPVLSNNKIDGVTIRKEMISKLGLS